MEHIEERYVNDEKFRGIVDAICVVLADGFMTTVDVMEGVVLANRRHEQRVWGRMAAPGALEQEWLRQHIPGEVWQAGKRVGWFDYDGRGGWAISHLVFAYDDLHLGKMPARQCSCVGEPAQLYIPTGEGYWWWSEVCFTHRTIMGFAEPGTDGVSGGVGHPYPLKQGV